MRNKRAIQIAILIAVPLLALVIFLNGPSIVTIESEPGIEIALANERSDKFNTIGTGKVTHIIFGTPSVKYISATKDGEQTITTIKTQRWGFKKIKIAITDTVKAKKVFDGAVINPIFDGNKGRGIVASQNILVNFNTENADEPVDPELVGLPYIQKIIWYDYNNFVYLADEGVGQFINGVDEGFQNVGTTTSGDVRIEAGSTTSNGSPYIRDIAKENNNPLVLLSNTNIFTSQNMGSKLRAIQSFDPPNSDISLFTSGESIFKVTAPELSHTDSEDQHSNKNPRMLIEEISYSGKLLSTNSIDDDQAVITIIKNGNTIYILTYSGMYIIRDGKVQKESLYFTNISGMTLYQDELVVLADEGLWKLMNDGHTYQLLYRFSDSGVALEGSMAVDLNNQLYFGTRPKIGSPDQSATYITSLSSTED